jgi:hypothetical protein
MIAVWAVGRRRDLGGRRHADAGVDEGRPDHAALLIVGSSHTRCGGDLANHLFRLPAIFAVIEADCPDDAEHRQRLARCPSRPLSNVWAINFCFHAALAWLEAI